MTYNEFQNKVIEFFLTINNYATIEYSNKISEEKLNELKNFNASNIVFYNDKPTSIENNILYINNNYFSENGYYDINKFENLKRKFLEKYFEKFIVFDYEKDQNKVLTKYSVEQECNKFIKEKNLDIQLGNDYSNEYILVLIKNKMGINYSNYVYQKDVKALLEKINDEQIIKEYKKKEKEEELKDLATKSEEEQISKTYGINLDDIEVVNVKGKKYYKIKKEGNYLMIESNTNLSIVQDFQQIQDSSETYQNDDDKKNTNEIVDHMLKNRSDVRFISINKINEYLEIIEGLNPEQKKCIEILINNKDKYNIQVINIYNGIAIDEKGKLLIVEKNNNNGNYEIRYQDTNIVKEIKEDTDENQNEETNEKNKENQKRLVYTLNQNHNGFIDAFILAIITGFISGLILSILLVLMK